ncbi:FtsX-like permease family protein [Paenibacillus sp. SYP-B3998]|uniref:Putative hemin transport system permease protein HrtB n=1 Tax=Paenibacillus sp. SYP-B3998 TaxID=2678564 RepID=A0A6G3ZSI3_9BACL|nr:FtsX-like permease family protein [Paenibacillus sp. SYP-B3998]NEW05176.1 FtsX-like permease family protein [Paenibacillus sp. SYP-B3998]
MKLVSLLWSNILHRKTLSLLTICSVAVTVALVVFLLLCSAGVEQGAEKGYGPFEVTIGAKGSASQLALNTYYHIGAPTGNVPLALLEEVRKDSQVDSAFAMTTGDNYNGFPIVGMEAGYFVTRYGTDKQMASGNLYNKLGDAVIGSHVASALGLHVGDKFQGAHGLVKGAVDEDDDDGAGAEEHGHQHSFSYSVVGILPPLLTSDDRAIFTTLDYAWTVHESEQSDHKEVTTILVKPKTLVGAQAIKNKFGQMSNVQAIYTSKAVADVVNVVDKGTQALSVVTVICILLAAGSILLSLIAAVNERKKDVGLLRLIGKSKKFIWVSLIGEGVLLTLIGLISGLLIGHVGGFFSRAWVFEFSGLQIQSWQLMPGEWLLVAGTLLIGVLASVGPALQAYRVDPLQLFRS